MLFSLLITIIISIPIPTLGRIEPRDIHMNSASYDRLFDQDTILSSIPSQYHGTENNNPTLSHVFEYSTIQKIKASPGSVSMQLPEMQRPDLTLRLGLSKAIQGQSTSLRPIHEVNRYADASQLSVQDQQNAVVEYNFSIEPYQMHKADYLNHLDTRDTTDDRNQLPNLKLVLGGPSHYLDQTSESMMKDKDLLGLTLGNAHPAEPGNHMVSTSVITSYQEGRQRNPICLNQEKRTNPHLDTAPTYVGQPEIFNYLQLGKQRHAGGTTKEDRGHPSSCGKVNILGSSKKRMKIQGSSVSRSDKAVKSHQAVQSGE